MRHNIYARTFFAIPFSDLTLLIIFGISLYMLTIVSSLDNTDPIIQPRLEEYHKRDLSFVLSVIAQIGPL